MLFFRLAGRILILAGQVTLTLTLTIIFGYILLNLGPVTWIHQTWIGSHALGWLLQFMGWEGIEYTLDTLILLSYGSMLPPSIWISVVLSRYLGTFKIRGNKKCSSAS